MLEPFDVMKNPVFWLKNFMRTRKIRGGILTSWRRKRMAVLVKLIPVQEHDFTVIKDIYNHYVLNTTATFHTSPVTEDYLKSEIKISHPRYGAFIINYKDDAAGYCYLSQYKKRQAYDRTAEITIYLKPQYTGKGIGSLALKRLEETAVMNGICVLIAVVSGDNGRSITLFERAGFERCAHFKKVGEKFGKILDVAAYQKIILDG
jgi:phosphinothricin acetyltransferase